MNTFRALVLIPDSVPDISGDVWLPEGLKLAEGPVPVSYEFDQFLRGYHSLEDYSKTHLGYCTLEKAEDGRVYANIEFNSAWAHPEILARLTPAAGGVCKKRVDSADGEPFRYGKVIAEAYIHQVALCHSRNCDQRIKTLGEQGFNSWFK